MRFLRGTPPSPRVRGPIHSRSLVGLTGVGPASSPPDRPAPPPGFLPLPLFLRARARASPTAAAHFHPLQVPTNRLPTTTRWKQTRPLRWSRQRCEGWRFLARVRGVCRARADTRDSARARARARVGGWSRRGRRGRAIRDVRKGSRKVARPAGAEELARGRSLAKRGCEAGFGRGPGGAWPSPDGRKRRGSSLGKAAGSRKRGRAPARRVQRGYLRRAWNCEGSTRIWGSGCADLSARGEGASPGLRREQARAALFCVVARPPAFSSPLFHARAGGQGAP